MNWERVKDDPPDILLTNFMMLELLMTRQNDLDRKVIENCRGLRFVVLDELHTYRGRQGADVAMLMRRLKARIGDPKHPPICVGTSATMASEGAPEEKRAAVAQVASKIFSGQDRPGCGRDRNAPPRDRREQERRARNCPDWRWRSRPL